MSTATLAEKRITSKKWWRVGPLNASTDGQSLGLSVEPLDGPREFSVINVRDARVVSYPMTREATGGVLSPDFLTLAVTRQTTTRPGGLFNYDYFASRLGEPAELRLTDLGIYREMPRFSRDGRSLYFLSDDETGPLKGWVVRLDGTVPRRLRLQMP